jgi:hypothetical protein
MITQPLIDAEATPAILNEDFYGTNNGGSRTLASSST